MQVSDKSEKKPIRHITIDHSQPTDQISSNFWEKVWQKYLLKFWLILPWTIIKTCYHDKTKEIENDIKQQNTNKQI